MTRGGQWAACWRAARDCTEAGRHERQAALACIRLSDPLRPEAAATVAALEAAGLRAHLLSGDHDAPARQVAGQLGLNLLGAQAGPADKLDRVRELQRAGRRVLMVGDGVNDAPVLAAAEASVAVGQATAPARPGIFAPALRPTAAGPARLLLQLSGPAAGEVDLGPVTVHPDPAAARAAVIEADAPAGAVPFLKAAQWQRPFATTTAVQSPLRGAVPAC